MKRPPSRVRILAHGSGRGKPPAGLAARILNRSALGPHPLHAPPRWMQLNPMWPSTPALSVQLRCNSYQVQQAGVQEMTRRQVGLFDGLSSAERDNMLYGYFSAATDVGGHFPPVRSFARIFFWRRNVQVFASNPGAPRISAVLTNPKFSAGVRRARFRPGLRPGPRRQARRAGGDSGVNGAR
jgi:hypothetical protein